MRQVAETRLQRRKGHPYLADCIKKELVEQDFAYTTLSGRSHADRSHVVRRRLVLGGHTVNVDPARRRVEPHFLPAEPHRQIERPVSTTPPGAQNQFTSIAQLIDLVEVVLTEFTFKRLKRFLC